MLTRRDFTARSAALMAASGLRLPLWRRAWAEYLWLPRRRCKRPLLLGSSLLSRPDA